MISRVHVRWTRAAGAGTPGFNRECVICGTARPQQGLEYLCARMIDRGFVLPPRDLDALHRNLVALGLARMFDGDVTPFERPAYNSTAEIATGVRRLLGMDAAPASAKPANPENGLASTPQAS